MTALRNAISKLEMALSELRTLNSSGAISIDTDEHCKFMLYFYERTIQYTRKIYTNDIYWTKIYIHIY